MSDEQPTVSDPMLELAGEAEKKPSVLRKVVDWIFSPWIKEESTSAFDWQQDARLAYFDQQPLRAPGGRQAAPRPDRLAPRRRRAAARGAQQETNIA